MSAAALDLLVGVALIVAAAGIVIPVLPGTLLAVVALVVWAVLTGGLAAWAATAVALVILALGQVLKYLVPHRSMTGAGVPGRSIMVGGIGALVGFFVIPIVGLLVGFIGGVFAAELTRQGNWRPAWESTWVAMKATGFSVLIELGALVLAASVWVGAVATVT